MSNRQDQFAPNPNHFLQKSALGQRLGLDYGVPKNIKQGAATASPGYVLFQNGTQQQAGYYVSGYDAHGQPIYKRMY